MCRRCEGARVILGCRDEPSGLRTCEEIAAETGNNNVYFRHLDLASLASVRRFADQFLRRKPTLLTFFLQTGHCGFVKTLQQLYILIWASVWCAYALTALVFVSVTRQNDNSCTYSVGLDSVRIV